MWTEQAPRQKTNLFHKQNNRTEATTQKTLPLATRTLQNEKDPKTKGKPPKKQRYMAKQQKQNTTIITEQIDSETEQIHWQETNTTESVKKKLMVQFGFVANPSHSSRHNSSTVLANTPTWYYFSRPSHLAFHDFTKKVKPQKNLRSHSAWD